MTRDNQGRPVFLKEGYSWDEETQRPISTLMKRELDRERRAVRLLTERGYSVSKKPVLRVVDNA
jgi:hypothetical protein